MKPITFALVAIISCALSVSARAATLETTTGEPVNNRLISAEFTEVIAAFETNSIPVFDRAGSTLVDVLTDEKFYTNLSFEYANDTLSTAERSGETVRSVRFPVCASALSTLEMDSSIAVMKCEDRTYISARWMARVIDGYDDPDTLKFEGAKGAFTFSVDYETFVMRFAYTNDDLASRKASLTNLRQTLERQRLALVKAEEERRRLEEEDRKREAEELRQRAAAEVAALRTRVQDIAGQAVLLDGFLALPIASVAAITNHTVTRDENLEQCFYVRAPGESGGDDGDLICNESTWELTNFVPKTLSGRLYAALEVHNGVFSGVAFQHDKTAKALKVKLTSPDGVLTFNFALPARLQEFKTETRARIYPYTKDSAPKCTTSRVKRSAYTLAFTADEPYKYLDVTINSTSNATILVVWDESVLRMPNGSSSGVIHLGTRYSEKNSPQSNTPVAPRAKLEDILSPKATIRYSDILKEWVYSLFNISVSYSDARKSLSVYGSTQTVSGVLALIVGGKKVYENFSVTCTVKPGEYRI